MTGPPKSFFRILIVDDEEVIRLILRSMLATGGYESVDAVDSGQAAIEALGQREYHVVLLDKNMPTVDGIEVLKRGKQLRPHCEFIIITAYGSMESAALAMELGAFSYLTKPLSDIQEVLQRVEAATNRVVVWRHIQQLLLQLDSVRTDLASAVKNPDLPLQQIIRSTDLLRVITQQLEGLCQLDLSRIDDDDT